MQYSYKLNDTELLIHCLDYAITYFIDKDIVLEMFDELIHYRFIHKYDAHDDPDDPDDINSIPGDKMDACIANSGIDDARLSLECDLDDVRVVDVLLQLGFIDGDTLLEIKDYVKTL